MKNVLILIAVIVIFVAIKPKLHPPQSAPAPATPAPAAPPPTDAPTQQPKAYRSALGAYNGGLGTASLDQGSVSGRQIFTLKTISTAPQNGEVIRLRLSRPTFNAIPAGSGSYVVNFVDQDGGGSISVRFPTEGAEKLDLIERRTQPGLTFLMLMDGSSWKAVGREYRSDKRTYVW